MGRQVCTSFAVRLSALSKVIFDYLINSQFYSTPFLTIYLIVNLGTPFLTV